MKKSLLTLVALVATTAGFAQSKAVALNAVSNKVADVQQVSAPVKHQASMDAENVISSRRSAVDGIYYARPEGSYWVSGSTSSGGTFEYLVVPPFVDAKFINVSDDKTGKWTIGTRELNDDVDEDNNLIYNWDKITKGYVGYCPVYTAGDIAYQISDYILTMDSAVQVLHPFDYVKIHRYYGYSSGESAFQSGADAFDFNGDGTATTFYPKFRQYFEKPISPLTLHEVVLWAHSGSPEFTGETLKLVFNKVERVTNNDRTYRVPGEKIGEMKCVEADMSDSQINTTGRYPGDLTFANMTIDEFGTEEIAPLLIEDEFVITIEGTEDPNIDVRFYFGDQGEFEEEWDTWATPTYILPFDAEGQQIDMTNPNGLSYFGNSSNGKYCYNIAFHFYGEMDGIRVETEDDLNKQIAPVDGGDTASKPAAGEQEGAPAYVWTNYPFFLQEGDDYEDAGYYSFEGLPDWASVVIDPSYYEYETSDGSIRGLNLIWFNVEALPSGVTGRSATVYINSTLGVKSQTPLYIIQGDADPSGIQTIKFDANGKFVGTTFNMAGQKVGDNYKGLIIKDGRKVMNK